jgi:hypothetical protein
MWGCFWSLRRCDRTSSIISLWLERRRRPRPLYQYLPRLNTILQCEVAAMFHVNLHLADPTRLEVLPRFRQPPCRIGRFGLRTAQIDRYRGD